MSRLDGRRVAVIGAGSVGPGWGNGKATAVGFARQGARVLCVDRSLAAAEQTAGIIRDEGGVAATLAADVTARDSAQRVIETMQRDFAGIDVLHVNVGASSRGGTLETTEEEWARIFDLNVTAAWRLSKAALPVMRDAGRGVILFVSSLAAVWSGPYAYVSYEASKAALCRFARSLALENARHGIRVNTILPGAIDTPHVTAFVDGETDPRTLAEMRAAMVPLGRQGTAWDVANAALFLASDEAGFITGVDLRVDGGMGA